MSGHAWGGEELTEDEWGVHNVTEMRRFVTAWREATANYYMGGSRDDAPAPVRSVMDGDGGLLIALDMLERVLDTSAEARQEVFFAMLSVLDSQPVPDSGRHMIQEEP